MTTKDFDFLVRKAEIAKAISHPIRLSIIRDLALNGPKRVSDIETGIEIPLPTVSQHLARLKYAGLLKKERKGVEIYYSLREEEKITEMVKKYLQ